QTTQDSDGIVQTARAAAQILLGGIANAAVVPDFYSQVAGNMVQFGDVCPCKPLRPSAKRSLRPKGWLPPRKCAPSSRQNYPKPLFRLRILVSINRPCRSMLPLS